MGMTQYAEPKELTKEELAAQVAAAEAARNEWDPVEDPTIVPGATPAVTIEEAEVIETPPDACVTAETGAGNVLVPATDSTPTV